MADLTAAAREPAPRAPAADERRRRLVGIGSMVLGIAAFTGMDALGKWLIAEQSVFQMLAVRSTVATALLLLLLPRAGGRAALATSQPLSHAARSLCGFTAFACFFTSVRYLPLADAVAVAFGSPFLVTALSVLLLGERVGARRWAAVAAGFGGMLLIVQPTGEGFRPEALLVLASSLAYALMMILTRHMSRSGAGADESSFAFVFYTLGGHMLLAWPLAARDWHPLGARAAAMMAVMGVLGLAGNLGITLAFRRAPAAVVAPYEYTGLVWATLLGVAVFGELPGPMVWLGAAVIVAAGLLALAGTDE